MQTVTEKPPKKTLSYTLWTFDVWGNEADGWEVNDRCKLASDFQITTKREDFNVGTAQEFSTFNPTNDEIRKALVAGGYLKPRFQIETDGNGEDIDVTQRSNDYPLFSLELNESDEA